MTMTVQNKKLWAGLLMLAAIALVSSAAVFGGIEGALASLGAMALIGMIGISIYVITKIRSYSKLVKCVTYDKPAEAAPISKKDKRSIMANIDRLIVRAQEQSEEKPLETVPVSKKDKKLIMKHIDELFETAREQSEEKPAEAAPISKEDKKLIMANIDRLFETDWKQSQQMFS